MRFASFFSGIGGFELGLERAGHRCVFTCEIEPFARQVYQAHFGREPAKDVTRVSPEEIPDADLWCGGFPCQDLSSAAPGVRAGLGPGTRSGLVWRFLDLARERRPDWLLLENVPGLLFGRSADDALEPDDEAVGEPAGDLTWFGALLGALDERGYLGAWRVLDAKHFGVPQRRRRVFVLARRSGAVGPSPASILLEPEGVRRSVAPSRATGSDPAGAVAPSSGEGVFAPSRAATLTSGGTFHGSPSGRRTEDLDNLIAFDLAQVTHPENRSRCRPGEPAPSIASTNQPHVATASCVRRLTPLECERLQGFPDDWTLIAGATDSKRYHAIGNAVAVPVIEWIGRRLA